MKLLVGLLLLVLAAAAVLLVSWRHATTAAAPDNQSPSVLVQLAQLRRGSLPLLITGYGTVRASSSAERSVTAPFAGVIGRVYTRQGQEVAKGAPLTQLSPNPQTLAAYAQARSGLQAAAQLVARTRTMVGQHLATGQQLTDAVKAESDARTTLAALDAEGAGATQLLRAPFAAIVTAVSASSGAAVAQGAVLFTLAPPTELVIEVGVIPDRAAGIEVGDAADIEHLGAEDPITAKVLMRGSVVDPATGLVPVDIAVPSPGFFVGQMVEADIVTGKASGFIVPHGAILVDDGGHPFVVQVRDMRAKKVPVRVLAADSGRDVIEGPLDPAAPIVLAGNYQLDNGMRVRLANPGEAPP